MSFNMQSMKGSKACGTGYAEDEILMPTQRGGMLPGLLELEVQVAKSDGTELLVADADYIKVHLSTKSQDAIIDLSDPDCICRIEEFVDLVTSGKTIHSWHLKATFPAPVLVSSAKLYLGVKCAQTGTLHYELKFVPRPAKGVVQQNNLQYQVQY